jgi:hypothetical protein
MCRYRVGFFSKICSVWTVVHTGAFSKASRSVAPETSNGRWRPPNGGTSATARWLIGGFTRMALSWRSSYRPGRGEVVAVL